MMGYRHEFAITATVTAIVDWFLSCVDQYSTLLYQKLFFKCSTSLHNILSNIFLTIEPDTSVQKKLIFPPIIDALNNTSPGSKHM